MHHPMHIHTHVGPLRLFPVIIQGWVSPVQPAGLADGGISKKLYHDDPRGLMCLIDPLTTLGSIVLAVDDRVDLHLGNRPMPVDGHTIQPGEENIRMRLYVPQGLLREGVNEIYYRVTRPSGNPETSDILRVLYHAFGPGERDPRARLDIPADVLANGVDAERAAQGVTFGFNYSDTRPYDTIYLTAEATDAPVRLVAPGEALPTETHFSDFFRQVGDRPRTPFSYTVFDQLGNFCESDIAYIDVHLNRAGLVIDTSPLNLTGITLSIKGSGLPWSRLPYQPADSSGWRPASGGVPPYTYRISNEEIATVNNNGEVISEGNGTAVVTVRDSIGQEKSFTVNTANVTKILYNPTPQLPAQVDQWVRNAGGSYMDDESTAQFQFLRLMFGAASIDAVYFNGHDYPAQNAAGLLLFSTFNRWDIGTTYRGNFYPGICWKR